MFLTIRLGEFENNMKMKFGILPSVKSTSDICMVDEWYQFFIWSAFEIPISLSKINIDHDLVLELCHCECKDEIVMNFFL